MKAPYILISAINPENGKKLDAFDKHSRYVVFVKDTRHNLSVTLSVIEEKVSSTRPEKEAEWLRKYLVDLSQKEAEQCAWRRKLCF